jgi:hypothetical protein
MSWSAWDLPQQALVDADGVKRAVMMATVFSNVEQEKVQINITLNGFNWNLDDSLDRKELAKKLYEACKS